ncbi:Glutathione reductase [invertebrate metagenome]|uniref:Glutathione reductase n=1 Tax=invertebrate metagenome TaxID=1711999 RepID=A0A2H9TA27_9ZZZZ
MKKQQHFDYLVIGGGSGGIATANRAALYGARVALVEAGPLGGTCVNVGCVPKKIMWYAGQISDALHYGGDYGFSVNTDEIIKTFDWKRLVDHRQAYIERLHGLYEKGLNSNNITLLKGFGRFVDGKTVEVNGEEYTADHITIAVGGYPIIPDVPGAEYGIDSNGFFELTHRPNRVAVVGAGYIAVELSGMLHALGSETHLLVRKQKPLRNFDGMLSDSLVEAMTQEGPTLHTRAIPLKVVKEPDSSLTLHTEDGRTFNVDCLIWAIGRSPNTAGLQLDAAGVEIDERGYIPVDTYQNTNVSGIYAVGDNIGKIELTPVAIAAGRCLSERLFNDKPDEHLDYTNVATVVFSHPPIGTIGLTEAAARNKLGDDQVKVYTSQFNAMYTGITQYRQLSRMKLVVRQSDEKVLGIHTIGYGSDEIMQGFAVALNMGATKKDLDNTVAIHPTSAEELVTMR